MSYKKVMNSLRETKIKFSIFYNVLLYMSLKKCWYIYIYITNYVSLGVIFRFLLNLRRLKVSTLWVVKSLEKPKCTEIPRKTIVLYLIYIGIYKYVCIRIFLWHFFHSDIIVLLDWSNTAEIVFDTASEKNAQNIFKQNYFSEMCFVKKLKTTKPKAKPII